MRAHYDAAEEVIREHLKKAKPVQQADNLVPAKHFLFSVDYPDHPTATETAFRQAFGRILEHFVVSAAENTAYRMERLRLDAVPGVSLLRLTLLKGE